jgi:hypothetical protein
MKHAIKHDLDVPTAKKVAERAFAEYQARFAQYDPQMRWADDRRAEIGFHAMGMNVRGSMEVEPQQIDVDLDVPFLLRPFRSKALEVIEREVNRWIGKAKAGEI